jgi:predicted enzyme related to lactoylglutathione lyase
MFGDSQAFSGFSVNDIVAAKKFYGDVLGLHVEDGPMGLRITLPTGAALFVYAKPTHLPATYTILNFPVEDIDEAVEKLEVSGVTLERYEGITDEKGISRGISIGQGPDIAWFRDPAGNILAVLQEA